MDSTVSHRHVLYVHWIFLKVKVTIYNLSPHYSKFTLSRLTINIRSLQVKWIKKKSSPGWRVWHDSFSILFLFLLFSNLPPALSFYSFPAGHFKAAPWLRFIWSLLAWMRAAPVGREKLNNYSDENQVYFDGGRWLRAKRCGGAPPTNPFAPQGYFCFRNVIDHRAPAYLQMRRDGGSIKPGPKGPISLSSNLQICLEGTDGSQ